MTGVIGEKWIQKPLEMASIYMCVAINVHMH